MYVIMGYVRMYVWGRYTRIYVDGVCDECVEGGYLISFHGVVVHAVEEFFTRCR